MNDQHPWKETLSSVSLGDPLTWRPLAFVPLLDGPPAVLEYDSLAAAMSAGTLRVSEVSEGGAVPRLTLTNAGPRPVLIVDGEELAGAKQNRVLNTSVLAPANAVFEVPVSCTEQGRWAYTTRSFADSGELASRSVRRAIRTSVKASLDAGRRHDSDQGRVWSEIANMSSDLGVSSATSAMRDVYEARAADIQACVEQVPLVQDQRGLVVLIGSDVVGLEWVSRVEAYAQLHEKLVRSYAVDPAASDAAASAPHATDAARDFLSKLARGVQTVHSSVGLGEDRRLEGEGLLGSALTLSGEAIHVAAFRHDPDGPAPSGGRMSTWRTRSRFRSTDADRQGEP